MQTFVYLFVRVELLYSLYIISVLLQNSFAKRLAMCECTRRYNHRVVEWANSLKFFVIVFLPPWNLCRCHSHHRNYTPAQGSGVEPPAGSWAAPWSWKLWSICTPKGKPKTLLSVYAKTVWIMQPVNRCNRHQLAHYGLLGRMSFFYWYARLLMTVMELETFR